VQVEIHPATEKYCAAWRGETASCDGTFEQAEIRDALLPAVQFRRAHDTGLVRREARGGLIDELRAARALEGRADEHTSQTYGAAGS